MSLDITNMNFETALQHIRVGKKCIEHIESGKVLLLNSSGDIIWEDDSSNVCLTKELIEGRFSFAKVQITLDEAVKRVSSGLEVLAKGKDESFYRVSKIYQYTFIELSELEFYKYE